MARVHLVAKYTFFVIIVLGAGLAIERVQRIHRWWKSDSYEADDLIYNISSPMASGNFNSFLDKHYLKCITQPAKPFCLLSKNKRLEIFRSEQEDLPEVGEVEKRLQNITSDFEPRRRRIHSLLVAFTRLMKANNVKVVLVEPSMLFCLLSSSKKFDMLEKGFNPGRLLGSRNVVTVGILDEDSKILETNNFTKEILSAGFKVMKFRKWIDKEFAKSFETAHYFFVLQDVAVHLVKFFSKNSYLWHSGLDPKEIEFEGLLFINEGIFENFTFLPLDLSGTSISQIFLPFDIQHFMEEIESSTTVECKSNSSNVIAPVTHPNLTKEQLHKRVVITLKELKTILISQVAAFWLWSKSLLGWFEKCDIFYYSTTFDLALTFRSIQGLNFTEILNENEFLKISDFNKSESEFYYKVDCHGLHVNIFILHEDKDKDVLWYKFGKDHDRLTYPVFPLCSSQIFGQKIHVPCNTDDILTLEYEQRRTNHTSTDVPSKDNSILPNETET